MEFIKQSEKQMLELIEKIVNIDSGSYDKEGIDQVGNVLIEQYEKLGFTVERHENENHGDNLVLQHKEAKDPKVLILAHMDTVFPKGTAEERPFSIKDGRAYGPGVVDMQSSLVSVIYAIKGLQEENNDAYKNVQIVLNSDEEIGSPTSRELIEQLSEGKQYALVMESGRANGAIVSARRGGGGYTLTVKGKAAHSGVAPEDGISAVEELAHKIIKLEQLNDHENGIAINVGIINGGAATNMIPDYAKAEIDVRITREDQGPVIDQKIKDICATSDVPGTELTLEGGINRPPLELNDRNKELLQIVKEVGSSIGVTIEDVHTGGGSDASFPSALGVATIDGLGPVGGELHNENEYMVIETLTERCNLLAHLIAELSL
ncbi:MAG TPA: M20 family metallopeptidase [Bacillota bacterium]|nr:M20 family metallopeptidase [Bacillota bacterium]